MAYNPFHISFSKLLETKLKFHVLIVADEMIFVIYYIKIN